MFISIGLFHIYLSRKKKSVSLITDADFSIADSDAIPNDLLFEQFGTKPYALDNIISHVVGKIAAFSTTYPYLIPLFSISLTMISSIILYLYGDLETDPIALWVSYDSTEYKQKQYFDENFGPFYRTEQIFVVNETGSVLSYDTLEWWFKVERDLTQKLVSVENIGYQDLCFRPLEDSSCIVESFTQYFHGKLPGISDWESQLKGCADIPVNCLPDFQQPISKNLIFSNTNIFDSNALVVTLLLSDHSYSSVLWETELEKYLLDLTIPEGLRISFKTEMSLEKELNKNSDILIICISYLLMFFYASWALKRIDGSTRF